MKGAPRFPSLRPQPVVRQSEIVGAFLGELGGMTISWRPNNRASRDKAPGTDRAAVDVTSELSLALIGNASERNPRTRCLLHVTTSSGDLAEKELLGYACANSFSDADRKISEHQPGTTIGSGIVKVCEAG
jgi:hypothetical protein